MIPLHLDGPAVEPVAVAEMRAFLRLDHEEEDALLAALIAAARLVVEATTRLALLRQRWRVSLARVPADGVVRLPLAPILSIEAVRLLDAAGAATLAPAGSARLEARADPPRLILSGAALDAAGGIEVDLEVGFGATPAAAPAPLVQAVRLLVAYWHENRGDGADAERRAASLPADVLALLAPYRRLRMG